MHPEYSKSVLLVTASDLEEALIAELGLETLRRSQLGQIISELAASVVEAAESDLKKRRRKQYFPDLFVQEETARIKKFVAMIPTAFHHHAFESGTRRIALFDQPLAQFNQATETIKGEPASRLQNAYGTVWLHGNALESVRSGEPASIHREHYLQIDPRQIEQLSSAYLRAPDLVSPLLEEALVGALVWHRIQHYAHSNPHAAQQLQDVPANHAGDGPLTLVPHTPAVASSTVMLQRAGLAVLELVALGVTYALASWLTSQSVEKWTLFTGITAARWVVTALRQYRPRGSVSLAASPASQLLWQLCYAYTRVPGMNVGLLRHVLYKLEEQGAALSPTIFDVLDRRGQRHRVRQVTTS